MLIKGLNILKVVLLAIFSIALSYSYAVAATAITACGSLGSGSYIVTKNFTAGSGVNCLVVTADNVTIDLGGFTITGSGASNGVLASGRNNVTVKNGTLVFARAVFATGEGAVIYAVRAVRAAGVSAGFKGFSVGDNATVENSYVTAHTGGATPQTGGVITAGKNSKVIGNTISGNSGNIIVVSDGSFVKDNTVTQNSGSSGSAILVSQNCKIVDNVISSSTFGVTATGDHNLISGNTISGCVEGIQAGATTIITGNNSSNNTDNGIEAGSDCVISGNNVSNNKNVGVTSDVRTQFLNNVANNNGNVGIHVNANGSAIGNVADGNTSSGLSVACPSIVANNTALGNGSPNLDESGTGCLNTNNLAP